MRCLGGAGWGWAGAELSPVVVVDPQVPSEPVRSSNPNVFICDWNDEAHSDELVPTNRLTSPLLKRLLPEVISLVFTTVLRL